MTVPRGRTSVIHDANTQFEIDNLWAALQALKIKGAQIDGNDVAPVVGQSMREGQLTVLEDVLDGSRAFTGLTVGSNALSGAITSIKAISHTKSGATNLGAGVGLNISPSSMIGWASTEDCMAVWMSPHPDGLYLTPTIGGFRIYNYTGGAINIVDGTVLNSIAFITS